jgi:hypothetical protein
VQYAPILAGSTPRSRVRDLWRGAIMGHAHGPRVRSPQPNGRFHAEYL